MLAAGPEDFRLTIEAPNGDVREVPLGADGIVIGRDESADVRVDDKRVSRRHALFKMIEGEPWVEDLGSANGVRINGKKISGRTRFGVEDRIRVGGFFVTFNAPAGGAGTERRAQSMASVTARSPHDDGSSVARSQPVASGESPDGVESQVRLLGRSEPVRDKVFVIDSGESIIGRLEECDIPILDGSVSRQHARIIFSNGRVTLSDLESANGLFVNDFRVESAELDDRDELRVGAVRFEVRLPASLARRSGRPVKARSRRAPNQGSMSRAWQVLGGIGLFSAAFVVAAALYWHLSDEQGLGEAPPPVDGQSVAMVVSDSTPADAPEAAPPAPVERAEASNPQSDSRSGLAGEQASTGARPSPVRDVVRTATSPFSRRDSNGLPLNLPSVDPRFDFDAFVARTLVRAQACEKEGRFRCVREVVDELLIRDPINTAAQALREKALMFEATQHALARAARLESRSEYGEAYRLLASVPEDVPQAQEAQRRREKIRKLAIDDELERAAQESRRRSTYNKAHERYLAVLGISPDSQEALDGLRKLERRMRQSKMRFTAYRPPHSRDNSPRTPNEIATAIRRFYDNNEPLARIAQAYGRGALDRAQRGARNLSKRGKAAERRRASRLSRWLDDLEARYERTRTEVSNNPERAWSMLIALREVERKVLPESVRSFLTRELEVSLSEAFAQRGDAMYDRRRFEEAFRAWESGYKLDATHPRALAGLKKLETQGARLMQEAEIAAQRGEADVCERYKRITRMTRGVSEVHRRARKRAFEVCG